MLKAWIKGSGLFVMDNLPFGHSVYRYLTRDLLDTQRSHITKLHRVWPGVLKELTEVAGALEGKRIWIHEAELTPFLACLNYLVTGQGGFLVNTRQTGSEILPRHLTESINRALQLLPTLKEITPVPPGRVRHLDSLRWCQGLEEFFTRTDTSYSSRVDPAALPLSPASADVVYSGGQLEHYRPAELRAWLREAFRILRPGGWLAPVIDHRDHLFHFDAGIPFLNHYRIPDAIYRLTHRGPLLYHNRLLPSQVAALMEQHGFVRVRLLRLALPSRSWSADGESLDGAFGARREELTRRFQDASDADLKTAAAHYVFRKPEG